MTTLEKLHHDIALDADLPLDQQLASLTSDAVALATRLDEIVAMLARESLDRDLLDCNPVGVMYRVHQRARAIAEGPNP